MSGWLDQAAVLEPMKIALPRSSGRASASRSQRNALRTSVCQKTENVSQLWRRVGRCGPVAPALSTRTRGRSRSMTRAAVTGSVASPATVSTRPFTSRASAASAPGSRATATTRMPAPASASTMPRPKPRLPPVTTAVWSRRSSTALLHPRVAAVDEEAGAGSAPCNAGARAGGRSWGTPTGTPRGRAALGSSPPRAPPSYGALAARSSRERVRLRDGPEPAGARLGAPRLRRAVDGHQAEGGAVAEEPLEVVEQAPVDVAAHVDPVGEAVEHARERAPDELDALAVV